MIRDWWKCWTSMERRVYAFLAVVLFVGVSIFFIGMGLQVHHFPPYLNPNTDRLRQWPFSGVKPKVLLGTSGDNQHVTGGFTNFSEALKQTRVNFWKSIKPGFTCPKKLLTKVGDRTGAMDGHKWTCGLATLGKRSINSTCIIYSFGVNTDSFFEAEVLEKTRCTIYAYDPFVGMIGYPLRNKAEPRLHFQKLGIGGENNGTMKTLKTLMQQNGHEWIDLVKMDVEDSEWASLNTTMKDFPNLFGNQSSSSGLPFGQLLVELHVWEWSKNISGPVIKEKAEMAVDFFKRLERWGLRMFHLEINNWDGNCCSEFSFLNANPHSLERFIGDIGHTPQP